VQLLREVATPEQQMQCLMKLRATIGCHNPPSWTIGSWAKSFPLEGKVALMKEIQRCVASKRIFGASRSGTKGCVSGYKPRSNGFTAQLCFAHPGACQV